MSKNKCEFCNSDLIKIVEECDFCDGTEWCGICDNHNPGKMTVIYCTKEDCKFNNSDED